MTERISTRIHVVLSFIRALLGEVSPTLRGITVGLKEKKAKLVCYFDGEIQENDINSMNSVEAEMLADLPEMEIDFNVERLDYPEPLSEKTLDEWLYLRREKGRD